MQAQNVSAKPAVGTWVTFMGGTVQLGAIHLNANGTATLSTSALTSGDHAITATFQGDNSFAGSTSAALVFRVTGRPSEMTQTALASSA